MNDAPGRPVMVLDALRTPIGRFRGTLSGTRPDDLAATVIRALAERNPAVTVEQIDDVALGAANQSGEDNRNVARMASLLAGLPVSTGGTTINRLCGSSLDAILYGYRAIALGEADVMVVGGVESMSRAPFVMRKPETAFPRELDLVDTTLGWRFANPEMPEAWTVSMGETAENVAERYGVSREDQDRFALASHQKAVDAIDKGRFDDEIVAVPVGSGIFAVDEGPRRDTSTASLAGLKPVFRSGGSVTAGNSSPLNDGAAALLLCSPTFAAHIGAEPIAQILGGAVAGVSPDIMGVGPIPAVERLTSRMGLAIGDIDAIELNEAFAVQSLAVLRGLGIGDADPRVNANGGAIAIGHPLGASGARIATTLVHRLRARGGGIGLATMCVGVGQGIALLVRSDPS